MPKIVVAFHSAFGHTKVIAESVVRGARELDGVSVEPVDVTTLTAPDFATKTYTSEWATFDDADAIVFGSPTYMGTVSAAFKTFMDATSVIWMKQAWKDKLAAGFSVSGSPSGDKLNTLMTMALFAAQHSMIWVGPADMPAANEEQNVNRLGSFLGVMAQADPDKAPDVHPPSGDHESARLFGRRIAELAGRLAAPGERS